MRWGWNGSGATSATVGAYSFPIGSKAVLGSPYKDYSGKNVTHYQLKSSGKWLTQPGGLEYFTNFDGLIAAREIVRVIAPDGKELWPQPPALTPVEPKPEPLPQRPQQEAGPIVPANGARATPTPGPRTIDWKKWGMIGGGVMLASTAVGVVAWLALRGK